MIVIWFIAITVTICLCAYCQLVKFNYEPIFYMLFSHFIFHYEIYIGIRPFHTPALQCMAVTMVISCVT